MAPPPPPPLPPHQLTVLLLPPPPPPFAAIAHKALIEAPPPSGAKRREKKWGKGGEGEGGRKQGSKETSKEARKEARKQGSKEARKQGRKQGSKEGSKEARKVGMDCNRDEAVRSKEIAERRFAQKDYAGAHKFAIKAKQLYPELQGLEQLIAVLEVHAHAHNHAAVPDWYAILQLDPSLDDVDALLVRKQYRKLALVLHPDKNPSVGAASAFKLITEAWSVLSDDHKKAAYDDAMKTQRSSMGAMRPPPRPPSAPSMPPASASVQVPANHHHQQQQHHHHHHHHQQQQQDHQQQYASRFDHRKLHHVLARPPYGAALPATFWTACPRCKLQFEYPSAYANKTLCCPICYKPFLARTIVVVRGTTIWPLQEHKDVHRPNIDGCNPKAKVDGRKENVEVRWPPLIWKKAEEMKRAKEELKSKVKGHAKEAITRFMAMSREVIEQRLSSSGKVINKGTAAKRGTLHGEKKPAGTMDDLTAANYVGNNDAEASGITDSAKKRDHEHDQHLSNQCFAHCGMQQNVNSSPAKKTKLSCEGLGSEELLEETDGKSSPLVHDWKCLANHASLKDKEQEVNAVNMSMACHASMPARFESMLEASDCSPVPKSEFYVFDRDRTEQHFSAGQVWACYHYDAVGAFPRSYAQVQNVVSREPFQISYAWLEASSSKSGYDASSPGSNSYYACGEYKVGDVQRTSLSIRMFSHEMRFEEGSRGTLKIYPGKGEVWALHKGQNSLKGLYEKHDYDLVEVDTDYSDDRGVQVATLAGVEGYKFIFQRQFGSVSWILPEDMQPLFSHRIPAHQLVAGEVPILLEGCWELDPISVP